MQVAFPMYPAPAAEQQIFWLGLKKWFHHFEVKNPPKSLSHPDDLHQHWAMPDVLLSQTCGYPLMTELKDKIQLIGAFAYNAVGCNNTHYRSFLIARADDETNHLNDFRHRTVAYNSIHSQSGYNCLRAQIAPLAVNGRFFTRAIESGSHHQSIKMVTNGDADIAAIDCVSFSFLQRNDPELTAQIKIIGETPLTPGLPLMTNANTSPTDFIGIQKSLAAAITDDSLTQARKALLITDFQPLTIDAYNICLEMQQYAASLGVDRL